MAAKKSDVFFQLSDLPKVILQFDTQAASKAALKERGTWGTRGSLLPVIHWAERFGKVLFSDEEPLHARHLDMGANRDVYLIGKRNWVACSSVAKVERVHCHCLILASSSSSFSESFALLSAYLSDLRSRHVHSE